MENKIVYKNNSDEVSYLIEKDPNLIPLFNKTKEVVVHVSKDYYKSLVQTIISQQLSSKVAQVIMSRFEKLMEGDITPKHILNKDDEALKSIGLSRPKIKYLKSLAEHVINHDLKFEQFEQMSDQEIIDELVKVKGIGIWTAQMFLMFSMGREDVFSTLDLGLRNALKLLLNQPDMSHDDIEAYSIKWKPYRSIVSHYLWHIWDES